MLNGKHRQSGVTPIGMAFIVLVLAVFFLVMIKLAPVYYDSFKVASALKSVAREPGMINKPNRDITAYILRQLRGIEGVKVVNSEDIRIERSVDKITVFIDYQVYKNVIGNVGFLVEFDKQAELSK